MPAGSEIDLSSYEGKEVFLSTDTEISGPISSKPHVLIMLHGIRTHAEWMDDFIAESIICNNFIVEPVSYGKFPTYRFLFGDLDIDLYKSIIKQIKQIIDKYPDHNISVMCHSFGTKLFSEICDLIEYKFHYIIFLAGLSNDRNAETCSGFCYRLINDFSKIDIWPQFAGFLNPKRFQACGTNAFHKHWVIDRPFRYKHSDYLNKKHFIEYIIPLIISNSLVYPVYDSKLPSFIGRVKDSINSKISIFLPRWIKKYIPFYNL